jgi:hypothetical protein
MGVWATRIMVAGPVIALAPVVLWLVFSIGCYNSFDESTCGGAVYLWYLISAIPLGVLVSFVGLVIWLVVRFRQARKG